MNPTHKALREATAAAHEKVDAAFGGFDLTDRASYARFLGAHAEIVWALEAALDSVAARIIEDWPERRRGAALREDLAFLRDAGQPTPEPVDTAPLDSDAAIAGTLYVLEGSRLGGRFLSRQLPSGFPRAYLNADQGAEKWRQLLERIDERLDSPGAFQAALAAADATFTAFARSAERWMAKG